MHRSNKRANNAGATEKRLALALLSPPETRKPAG